MGGKQLRIIHHTHFQRSFVRRAAAACLAVCLLSGCSLLPEEEETLQPPVQQKKEESYETTPVRKGNIEKYLKAVATAVSGSNASVSFSESGGRVKKMFVQEGDSVKAGSPIAELDTGDLTTRIKLQRLAVEQKQIRYTGAISKAAGKTDLRLSQIDLDREKLVLDSLEKQYRKSLLLSPINGVVTYVNTLDPSEPVAANVNIAVISDPNTVNLIYESTDIRNIAAVKQGTDVEVEIDDKLYKGKVAQTPSTAPKTTDEKIQRQNAKSLIISLNQPRPALKIGETADIKLFIEKRDNVLIIPRASLRSFLGRTTVQVLEGGRVKELDVQAGLTTTTEVEVIKGLEEGQKVIIDN
ncbi:efflux RND transporter periplasmic adaptor subunit [Paenibacillus sp. sptzw28]|uniref:efflux RND transporter periplasmic adaptor subunit n=1 Tax=Paenibacillus sp. sptzw28 TaxID=715179 RepID=UPI001C6E3C75|nr:HlyD family efflux transporter periplasmic adaptor subunit [Paenibacillus sp. sptzw28]QYR22673.1 efflux RND transporter periplasmic adaptor subunit [Paenibacillus sp. sptzw28]